ncbi:hypothetical protein [Microbulbifer sp. SSSA005]|uniref:hypothetical protein n=1 Tax=Microbulbifer sp. SSSA005 TaxID=3243378 RepID=UPI00403A29DB
MNAKPTNRSKLDATLEKYKEAHKMGEKMNDREVRIPRIYLRKIEKVIGVVTPDEESKFADFQEVDELTRNRVREIYYQLAELRAEAYLKYLLSRNIDRGHMFSFVLDVIIGGMDQDEWLKEKLGQSDSD